MDVEVGIWTAVLAVEVSEVRMAERTGKVRSDFVVSEWWIWGEERAEVPFTHS